MDILSDVFDALRPTGGVYFRADLLGGWAIAVPEERQAARLHLVLQGACYARLSKDHAPVPLNTGDMIIVPSGRAHFLADRPGRRPIPLNEVLKQNPLDADGILRFQGEGGQRVRLLCGACRFAESLDHPILAALPEVMILQQEQLGRDPWAASVLKVMALEADRGAMGMTGVLTRLLEALFIQAVRAEHQSHHQHETGFLAALGDQKISNALSHIHTKPDAKWTLSNLAREVGMSRSVFAERFQALVGEAPITYLTRWRLIRARKLLRETELSMMDIAEACGYQSVPSFTRRFTTAFGVGPGKFRRAGEEALLAPGAISEPSAAT